MHKGWIKLWRASTDNPLYFSEVFTKWQAWIDMLLLANHKPNTVHVRNIPVHLKRGQLLGCENFLAERWKWSRGKVRRFLLFLGQQNVHQIEQQKSNVCTVVTILNYETYQGDEQQTVQQTVPQADIPKNVKKEKTLSSLPANAVGIADMIVEHVRSLNPNAKNITTGLQKTRVAWASDIERMNRIDKREYEDIKAVLEWATRDDFWFKNVLSGAKLRKQYDQLVIKMGGKITQSGFWKSHGKNICGEEISAEGLTISQHIKKYGSLT